MFLLQLYYQLTPSDPNSGGVAYSAHVGGLLAGLLLVPLFTQSQRFERVRAYHDSRR